MRAVGVRDQRLRIREALSERGAGRPGQLDANDEAALGALVAAAPPIPDERLATLASARAGLVAKLLADRHGVIAARVAAGEPAVPESPRSRGRGAVPADAGAGPAVRRFLRIVGWSGLAILVVVGLVALAVWRELTMDLPTVTELLDYRPPTATRVLAADGTPIGEFYVERRYLVPIAEVPEHVRLAFLAAEDAEFYRHRGIDPAGIARALLANLRERRDRAGRQHDHAAGRQAAPADRRSAASSARPRR